MSRVVLIGAGGHAREVLDILLECREHGYDVTPLGFIDENEAVHGQVINHYPVLGDFRWFESQPRDELEVLCAVGRPASCRPLVQRAQALGLRFGQAVSPRAHISRFAQIGHGVMVFPNAIVNANAVVGHHVIVNVAATVSHDARVGDFCNINPGAHLAGNVSLGEGCYVGMGANVIQQVTIGAWTVVGAGAVVLHDLPSRVTAVGVPARVIKQREGSEST